MKILISALEHSANLHLEELLKYLPPQTQKVGIFDERLGKPTHANSALAIMGFKDVFKKIPFFLKLANQMCDLAQDCDKVLLIDSSGFNLPLAKKIRKRYPQKQIIYYILPQAWAWKKGRIKTLERVIDSLCSILPFEPSVYHPNAPIQYVGHPLLDEIKQYKEDLTNDGPIVFMPGSRRSEITALMPHFRGVAAELNERALLVIPPIYSKEQIKAIYGNIANFEIVHNAQQALYEAKFAYICSGTATLEASLIGTPFVLCYIAKRLDYFIASKLVSLSYIGLANILSEKMSDEPMHPELIQHDVRAEAMLSWYETLDRAAFLHKSQALRRYLRHGSAKQVAQILLGTQ